MSRRLDWLEPQVAREGRLLFDAYKSERAPRHVRESALLAAQAALLGAAVATVSRGAAAKSTVATSSTSVGAGGAGMGAAGMGIGGAFASGAGVSAGSGLAASMAGVSSASLGVGGAGAAEVGTAALGSVGLGASAFAASSGLTVAASGTSVSAGSSALSAAGVSAVGVSAAGAFVAGASAAGASAAGASAAGASVVGLSGSFGGLSTAAIAGLGAAKVAVAGLLLAGGVFWGVASRQDSAEGSRVAVAQQVGSSDPTRHGSGSTSGANGAVDSRSDADTMTHGDAVTGSVEAEGVAPAARQGSDAAPVQSGFKDGSRGLAGGQGGRVSGGHAQARGFAGRHGEADRDGSEHGASGFSGSSAATHRGAESRSVGERTLVRGTHAHGVRNDHAQERDDVARANQRGGVVETLDGEAASRAVSAGLAGRLGQELQLIQQARRQLRQHDLPGALTTLSLYRELYPAGELSPEATRLRAQAQREMAAD